MNYAHLHLLLNHFPIIGTIVGLGLFLISFLGKNEDLRRGSYIIFAAIALLSIPTFLSGYGAQDNRDRKLYTLALSGPFSALPRAIPRKLWYFPLRSAETRQISELRSSFPTPAFPFSQKVYTSVFRCITTLSPAANAVSLTEQRGNSGNDCVSLDKNTAGIQSTEF